MNPYSPPAFAAESFRDASAPYGSAGSAAVSDATVDLLRQTRPWVTLLGVLSFIGSGVMLLVGLGLVVVGLMASSSKPAEAALGLIYLPFALIYIYPGIKLVAYGSAIARVMATRSTSDLEAALGQQKSFWKFAGISSVVVIVLYIVGAMVAIAIGAAAAGAAGGLFQH